MADMVEMTVAGISLDAETRSPLLILRKQDANIIMPVWIGAMEALSISFALGAIPLPRPLTHDLLVTVMEQLGGTLSCVRITDVQQEAFIAHVEITTASGKKSLIGARPSDAIALALRTKAPIFAAEEIVRKNGRAVTPEQLSTCRRLEPGEFALLFASPQDQATNQDTGPAITPEDIFTEIRNASRARRLERMQKTLPEVEPKTWQNASGVDVSDPETLEKLLRILSPETGYKM